MSALSHADQRIRLIIDSDGVADDVRAISLALQHPNVDVIAFTSTHGCVSAKQAAANIARTQRANQIEKLIPIHLGSSTALIQKIKEPDESFFFGKDGIGDQPDAFPKVMESDFTTSWVENEPAALALIRLTRENPDAALVCLGPLTNIALALKLDEKFASQPRKVVIMGGNYYGVGNVNSYSSAEYNFYDDPEAASIVLSEMKSPLTLVPWEAFFIDGFKHEKEVDFEAHLRVDSPLARFLKAATSVGRKELAKANRQYAYCDEIAVATAIQPEKVIKESKLLRASVELAGTFTRGQVVPDYLDQLWTHEDNTKPVNRSRSQITFVTAYDVKYVDQLVMAAVENSA